VDADGLPWQELVGHVVEEAHLQRAWSAEDAHVLRRKGHLKEQDALIEFIISLFKTHTVREAFTKVERWVDEHRAGGSSRTSTLRRLVPCVGEFFTRLPLVSALERYDSWSGLTRRRYVAPNFAEVRHVLNLAQVAASSSSLKCITFDADGTLYADGHHFREDNAMIRKILALLDEGLHVGIVTAAGYPGDAARYEARLSALLDAFRERQLPPELAQNFHVVGGECNYLLRLDANFRLEFVPPEQWQLPEMLAWTQADVDALLDTAEAALLRESEALQLPVELVRKPRACGVVPIGPTVYETLEDLALRLQDALAASTSMPFCAFNGGNDVFCDVGNKSLGLQALQRYLRVAPAHVMHCGDRFTVTGNDNQVRGCCSILWVASPDETAFVVGILLDEMQRSRRGAAR
jgi:IMP and pyridine-specific 5'-nucleotidase